MTVLVESLARLYINNRIGKEKLDEMIDGNKINLNELNYIIERREELNVHDTGDK